jgi:type IV pilus assembly protein PilY1
LARPDYGHLYYVDLTPYITTLGNKKVLIGGMRLGGNVCHEKKTGKQCLV